MSISEERSSRYTFESGQLTPVTDPEELKRIHEKTGVHPLPADEQTWIAGQWKLRFDTDPELSTFKLSDEYRQLKAQGKI